LEEKLAQKQRHTESILVKCHTNRREKTIAASSNNRIVESIGIRTRVRARPLVPLRLRSRSA